MKDQNTILIILALLFLFGGFISCDALSSDDSSIDDTEEAASDLDCENAFTCGSSDQLKALCMTACAYKEVGETEAFEATCNSYETFRQNLNKDSSNNIGSGCCSVCSGEGGDGDGDGNTGEVSFYITSDFACGSVSVSVSGHGSRTINQYFPDGIERCGVSGTATFTLPPGEHTVNASCGENSWGPSKYTITAGRCLMIELTR